MHTRRQGQRLRSLARRLFLAPLEPWKTVSSDAQPNRTISSRMPGPRTMKAVEMRTQCQPHNGQLQFMNRLLSLQFDPIG